MMQQKQNRQNQNRQSFELRPLFAAKDLSLVNYVTNAEKVIREYQQKEKNTITTTQLRSLFSLLTELRESVRIYRPDKLDEGLMGRVQYVKMRFVYAAGRSAQNEKDVRNFLKLSGLIECLDTVGDSPAQLELVCKYMEALVAYHKFYIDAK